MSAGKTKILLVRHGATLLSAEEKFAIVADNLNDFERELLKATQDYILSSSPDYIPAMNIQLDIDRRLTNLLSSCRLYFDQIAHRDGILPGVAEGRILA